VKSCSWASILPLCVTLLFACVAAPADGASFPVESTGDIKFQVDCASFLGADGTVEEEFYVEVHSSQLNFEKNKSGVGEAQVVLTVVFVDALGDDYDRYVKEFKLNMEDEPGARDWHVIMARYPITPRAKSARIILEDVRARKRGILYLFTKETKSGVAVADLDASFPLEGKLSLSDIQFAWSIGSGESASFPKSGLDVIPNPSRNYGLRRPSLFAYLEVYDDSELAQKEPRVYYRVDVSVLNTDRVVVMADTENVVSSSDEWVHTLGLDLSELPGGSYWLRTEVSHANGTERAMREREFDVLWFDASWAKSDQDILDETALFLEKEELKEFRQLAPGERESYLEAFWKEHDPTQGTARNEIKEEFYRRVAYANANFSFLQKGILTDRGRIYVRYGEPDLIEKQVVPTTGGAAEVVVDEMIGRENIEPRISQKLGGRDKRSYEVWIYNLRGKPLFESRDRTMTQTLGTKFVFVDDTGVGNFILEYSTDYSKYR
jgi:GWxTD domain-containing protein